MNCHVFPTKGRPAGFTLIELLTVIAIIGILMALLFPAVQGAMENAKKVQAKNDIMQTLTAIKSFYTEYSRYPNVTADGIINTAPNNAKLYNILKGKGSDGEDQNPRGIPYFEAKVTGKTKGGFDAPLGTLYDPWGDASTTGFYKFVIDMDYDNEIDVGLIGGTGAAGNNISTGVAGMSDGKKSADKKDDVTSW